MSRAAVNLIWTLLVLNETGLKLTNDEHFVGEHESIEGCIYNDFAGIGSTVDEFGVVHEQNVPVGMLHL